MRQLGSGVAVTDENQASSMDLRGIQHDRGYSRLEDHQLDRSSIQAESFRLRSVAWTGFYRFKLTSPDQQLTDLATRAVEGPDAWDYRAAAKAVIAEVEASACFTVEALAARIARTVVAGCGAPYARVRVRKPGALRFADSAGLVIERTPADFPDGGDRP